MIRTIKISEIENLKRQGYVVLEGGDAAKANSDGFHILIREREGKPMDIAILCPTYLRGPLWIRNGSVSY
jgi:hypothetical protein